ncbi:MULTISPECIES: apolipoprotein N-acyltransferase [Streptomyces]|uniref:apolipoprotein N-acyltransferase n=1 Tax=Streptomyces TaxID=1883 RepID=UPI00140BB95B|nr:MULTISPECIES: apolipoprotein N-acyltransferase [Streptomyces]MDH6228040.1 apolipoprotein N-acyltransferase [Streptomyces sp. MJP52]
MTAGRWAISSWRRPVVAVAAGALPVLAFPEPGWWWIAPVALVPWLLLVRRAPTGGRAALDSWCGGFGMMFAAHHWLLPSLHVFTPVVAALLGAMWAPWGVLAGRLLAGAPSARRAAAALVALPSGWLMIELVRSWQGLGGPWAVLGASQWQTAPALRLASVGGVWLLSFLLVCVNVAVTLLVTARAVRAPAVAALVAVAVGTASAWAWAPRPAPGATVEIALVQPGVVSGEDSPERRFALQERLTRSLAGRGVDLVVWGESSVGADLTARPDLARRLAELSRGTGAPLLVNVDARRSDRPGMYKSSMLVGPDGATGDRYDKTRLVPFGEYVPLRSLLGWATSVGRAADEDRRRGPGPVVMDAAPGLRLGPLVCFESAFPDMSRHLAGEGAGLLVVQSSTSTFQESWAPEQHASLAALRAAETGVPMAHATLTGVSAVYDGSGRQAGPRLGTSERGVSVHTVPLAGPGATLHTAWGSWPLPCAAAALLVLTAARAVVRRR